MINQIGLTKRLMKDVRTIPKGNVQCQRCEWYWKPRIDDPLSCPRCKSYDWKKKKP